ncbi:hypothetical protein ONZ43_g2450 [Nemania bipapillata]|uniref:Uncharacterized protein n=1 Tax=Nemania bipapillata TaxID=110536 RepID=A0ACC2J1E9_9PEZI|nr:hypothetical protein ONZ43_g2450 [Nemania bipapillata]
MSTEHHEQQARQQLEDQQRVFHLFGQLPAELRLEIWTHTWQPRTVVLCPVSNTDLLCPNDENRLPASGYVNWESRSETLRYYKPCFAVRENSKFRWFNHRLDTLCLAQHWYHEWYLDEFRFSNADDLRQVRRLILPQSLPDRHGALMPCPSAWSQPARQWFPSPKIERMRALYFPQLREVILISHWWYAVTDKNGNCVRKLGLPDGFTLTGEEGHLRTDYLGGLKVRHLVQGKKTWQQRYSWRLTGETVGQLESDIASQLDLSILARKKLPQ